MIAARLKLGRAGRDWRGDCPACGYAGAFVVTQGKARPVWRCASCQDQIATGAAVRAAMGAEWTPPPLAKPKSPEDAGSRSVRALAMWDSAVAIGGTPACAYLSSRGLPGTESCALRFAPAVRHPNASGTFPAMLGLVVSTATGEPIALHRTYIRSDGSGKADLDPAKASKGPIRGGAIMLQAPRPGRPLVIGEGIETSIAAGLLLGVPAWAAIAAGNLSCITPPSGPSEIIIAADNDLPGLRKAWAAARCWRAAGHRVRVAKPDAIGTDFNDLWRALQARDERGD